MERSTLEKSMKRTLMTLLLLGGGAAIAACNRENLRPTVGSSPACHAVTTAEAPDGSPDSVVGRLDGQAITAKELDEHTHPELVKLRRRFDSDAFDVRKKALDEIVITRLIQAEAQKDGLTQDAWLAKHMADSTPASDSEAKKFYDQNVAQMGGHPFEEEKPRIVAFLTNERRKDAATKLFEELRAKASIEVDLEEPTVAVEAVGPSIGPEDAPVTIVEFSDFQCPFCSRVEPTLKRVMKDFAGKVRFVFRDYPLPFHDHAEKASEASHCADAQGKYWPVHDAMFLHQDELSVEGLKKLAASVDGMNVAKFDKCLDSGEMADQVAKNQAAGDAAGVEGTPHFFVNGHPLSGALPYEEFKRVIDGELARSPAQRSSTAPHGSAN
jgi:protein-disulfide isomerase